MQKLTIKKGYRFRMAGAPADDLVVLPAPARVAVLPERIPHIKPRLLVKKGDQVQIGSPLFEDKRNPRFKFLSPGGGTIHDISFGPRRVIQAIVIDRKESPEPETRFQAVTENQLAQIDRQELVDRILDGGMWWAFRELPFRDLPAPDGEPPFILISLNAKEPFQPSPAVYLKDQEQLLAYGLKALNVLAPGKVRVFADASESSVIEKAGQWLTHAVSGNYPCDDPATVLYRIKSDASQNRAWFVAGQDLLALAHLLREGRYPIRRVVAVAGSAAPVRRHCHIRLGAPLSQLVEDARLRAGERFVVGGLFRGYSSDSDGYVGFYETAVNVVPEGGEPEFLALFNPGVSRPSYSRTFLSRLNPKALVYNCNMHGDLRACIACMHCADVCPVDLLPQMIYKSVLAEEVEEYLELGLLDCVECGLCSYVCPSKIELSRTFIATKAAYAKEQAVKTE